MSAHNTGLASPLNDKKFGGVVYRLRNKIVAVCDDIRIEYDDKKNIKLTFTNL